jgi:hypothetical protein
MLAIVPCAHNGTLWSGTRTAETLKPDARPGRGSFEPTVLAGGLEADR